MVDEVGHLPIAGAGCEGGEGRECQQGISQGIDCTAKNACRRDGIIMVNDLFSLMIRVWG